MHSVIEKAIGKTPVYTSAQYYVIVGEAKKASNS